MSVDSNGVWSGPLYQTTGTFLGNPWNSNDRSTTQVGTVTFNPSTSYAGTLTYNVNSTNVTKQITRQTLKAIPLGGNYSGAYLSIYSNCNDPGLNGGGHLLRQRHRHARPPTAPTCSSYSIPTTRSR